MLNHNPNKQKMIDDPEAMEKSARTRQNGRVNKLDKQLKLHE